MSDEVTTGFPSLSVRSCLRFDAAISLSHAAKYDDYRKIGLFWTVLCQFAQSNAVLLPFFMSKT